MIRLLIGLAGLLVITFMTIGFGWGGFLFTLALFAVIAWAASGRD